MPEAFLPQIMLENFQEIDKRQSKEKQTSGVGMFD